MVKTHKILIPNMAVTQFRLMAAALECEGYNVEILGNCGSEVAQLGLKYVHNDTCYRRCWSSASLSTRSTAANTTWTTRRCSLPRPAAAAARPTISSCCARRWSNPATATVPVASLNFSGLEKNSGLPITLPLLRKVLASIFYGDMLCALRSQVKPYEDTPGAADEATERWIAEIQGWMRESRNYSGHDMKREFPRIAADFAKIPRTVVPKVKVGVVGEIYVKYSPLGNNDLEKFLESQDCEVNLPGLMGFVEYCIANQTLDVDLYGGSKLKGRRRGYAAHLAGFHRRKLQRGDAPKRLLCAGVLPRADEKPEGVISLGAKMGEGWLLTAEMIELVEGGYANIVCAQPFGCLPNHIVGKGMINKIRALHPEANITPIDYDPSATRVNQENRIKLMLAVARENLGAAPAAPRPLTAEDLAGGAPPAGNHPARRGIRPPGRRETRPQKPVETVGGRFHIGPPCPAANAAAWPQTKMPLRL